MKKPKTVMWTIRIDPRIKKEFYKQVKKDCLPVGKALENLIMIALDVIEEEERQARNEELMCEK